MIFRKAEGPASPAPTSQPPFWLIWPGFALFALAVRWQTLGNPVVGFDEQFYLLVGDRMWHHALPYVDIWDRKPIGLFIIFAAVRALGGDGFLAYKLVALVFVTSTASIIARLAARHAGRGGAAMAGALYILWLNFTECEGGQADVFFALPMVLAAWLVWAVWAGAGRIHARGVAAMALVGIALQIKYSIVVEGVFFGIVLLAAQHRRGAGLTGMAGLAAALVAVALAPTVLAMAWYWHIGQLPAFVFANFFSQFGRNPLPAGMEPTSFAMIAGILLPLAVMAWLGWRRGAVGGFALVWVGVSLAEMVVLGNVGAAHYAAETLIPLTIAAGGAFRWRGGEFRWRGGASRWRGGGRQWIVAVLVLFFALGQIVLWRTATLKGGAQAAAQVAAAAAAPGPKAASACIYVYDGYPALYLLTHSCLPTRFAFPGMLDTWAEASPRALGTDPAAEEARILASRPKAIIDDDPVYEGGNRVNHAAVLAALRRDYYLAARIKTGTSRYRLVYRLKPR